MITVYCVVKDNEVLYMCMDLEYACDLFVDSRADCVSVKHIIGLKGFELRKGVA